MEGSSSSHFLTTLLFLLFLAFTFSSSAARLLDRQPTTKYLKTSCRATNYPSLCLSSLASQANTIQSDPKLLAHAALSVTLNTVDSTSTELTNLAESHGLKPTEAAAMQDCIEELSDSVDQLRSSMAEMSQLGEGSRFGLTVTNIQTWVSAALTDDDMCTEGLAKKGMNGNLKTGVRGKIVNLAHLTSNALALFNRYATLHGR